MTRTLELVLSIVLLLNLSSQIVGNSAFLSSKYTDTNFISDQPKAKFRLISFETLFKANLFNTDADLRFNINGSAHLELDSNSEGLVLALPGEQDPYSTALIQAKLEDYFLADSLLYLSFWTRIDNLPSQEITLLATHTYSIRLSDFGWLRVDFTKRNSIDQAQQWKLESRQQSLTLEKWHRVELQFNGTKPNGGLSLWIDEELVGQSNRFETIEFHTDESANSMMFGAQLAGTNSVTYFLQNIEIWDGCREDLMTKQKIILKKSISVIKPLFDLETSLATTSSIKNVDRVLGISGWALKFQKEFGTENNIVTIDLTNYALLMEALKDTGMNVRFWLNIDRTNLDPVPFIETNWFKILLSKDGQLNFQMQNPNKDSIKGSTSTQLLNNIWHLVQISWQQDQGLIFDIDSGKEHTLLAYSEAKTDDQFAFSTEPGKIHIGGMGFDGQIDSLQLFAHRLENVYKADYVSVELDRQLIADQQTIENISPNENILLPEPKNVLKRAALSSQVIQPRVTPQQLSKIDQLEFSGNNYIKFNFKNKLTETSENENLVIRFSVAPGVKSHLIWYAESEEEKSFLFLNQSQLHYAYFYNSLDVPGRGRHKLREDIYININIVPNKIYNVQINRKGDNMVFIVDGNQVGDSKYLSKRIPILPPNGNVFIGGNENPRDLSEGAIFSGFKGNIYEVRVDGAKYPDFNFLSMMNDPNWRSSWNNRGGVVVRRPQNPNSVSDGAFFVSNEPVSITFHKEDALVRFEAWDFIKYKSLEFSFTTNEPRGILFFTGPASPHTDFVCVELFDGSLFFVVSVNDNYYRVRLNPMGSFANDGNQHTVYFSRDESHKFLVKYDSKEIRFEQIDGHQQVFSTYTYIGGIDSISRLPWSVWSRIGFTGCIHYLRINDETYIDPQRTMNQYTSTIKGITYRMCDMPSRPCDGAQNNSLCNVGACYNRFEDLSLDNANYDCDCSATSYTYPKVYKSASHNPYVVYGEFPRSEICADVAPIKDFDESGLEIVFRGDGRMMTHTDDISIQFKTSEPNGILFDTYERNGRFIRLYLQNNQLFLQTNVHDLRNKGQVKTIKIPSGQLSDSNWHTVYIKRRASNLETWVDQKSQKIIEELPLLSPGETFESVVERIYVGSPNPKSNEPLTKFNGEMRNFYWNQYDFFNRDNENVQIIGPPSIINWPPSGSGDSPVFPVSCNRKHIYSAIGSTGTEVCSIFANKKNIIHVQFKTRSEYGLILQFVDPLRRGQNQIGLVIAQGLLYLIMNLSPDGRRVTNPLLIPLHNSHYVSNNEWHRVGLVFQPSRGTLTVMLDEIPQKSVDITKITANEFPERGLSLTLCGISDNEWNQFIKPILATDNIWNVPADSISKFQGCIANVYCNSQNDILITNKNSINSVPPNSLVLGQCPDVYSCSGLVCLNGGNCELSPMDIEICRCLPGYEGQRCELQSCTDPNFCLNSGICRAGMSGPICQCLGGWSGNRCQNLDCTPGYCFNGGRCISRPQGPYCECPPNYEGSKCETPRCRPDHCLNGGTCLATSSGIICRCLSGFSGLRCESRDCMPGYCLNGGQCQSDSNSRLICSCSVQFEGERCERDRCIGFCQNGGRCILSRTGQLNCDCAGTGYTGQRCTNRMECRPGFCLNGGICTFSASGQEICNCLDSFQGDRCEISACPQDYCRNGGVCVPDRNRQNEFACQCRSGFYGPTCDYPRCSPNFCYNGGTCEESSRGPVCNCRLYFTGERCEEEGSCPNNFCNGRGTCKMNRQTGRPECECQSLYYGDRCDYERCQLGFCRNEGVCRENPNRGRYCECPPLYEGEQCEVDKCRGYCYNKGVCTQRSSSRGMELMCQCPTGFRGSRCEEVAQCQSGFCRNYGLCSVRDGVEVCDCLRTGYTGKTCEDPTPGYRIGYYNPSGYQIYNINQPSSKDQISIGFQTWLDNPGTLGTFLNRNGKYYSVRIEDGYLVFYRNDDKIARFDKKVNDGQYHILHIDRDGSNVRTTLDYDPASYKSIYIDEILESDKSTIFYDKFILGANKHEADFWRGNIGGFNWNGEYLQTNILNGNYTKIFTPEIPLPPLPKPTCYPNPCVNGRCEINSNVRICNCLGSGFGGEFCQNNLYGFEYGNGNDYAIYRPKPSKSTTIDDIRLLFQTWYPTGTLARFLGPSGNQFFEIFLDGGNLYLSPYDERDKRKLLCEKNVVLTDANMYTIHLQRNGRKFNTNVYSKDSKNSPLCKTEYEMDLPGDELTFYEIYLGTDSSNKRFFNGAYGGFFWNGWHLINQQGVLDTNANKFNNLQIKKMPVKLPFPEIGPVPADAGSHGGLIFGKGSDLFIPGGGNGGGGGVIAGSGPVVITASLLGGNPLSLLWWAILLPLLMLFAFLLWACWRCKPGCCPCCTGDTAAKANGFIAANGNLDTVPIVVVKSVKNKLVSVSQDYEGNVIDDNFEHKSTLQRNYEHEHLIGNDGKQLISTPASDLPIQNLQQNVFFSENMKVDCFVMTENSKFVVTGSSSGPPQIWDMTTGNLSKVMDGHELGCTDLHLASGDNILVGQVHDEVTDSFTTVLADGSKQRVHRLQLWDFAAGDQIDMGDGILSTASCLDNSTEFVIANRVLNSPSHACIVIWDIFKNGINREIFYTPIFPNSQNAVTYINTSRDDRFVIAGFQNISDGKAYYMVFDLKLNPSDQTQQPVVAVFPALVNCTEILSNVEAVTGLSNGNLTVWDLKSGLPLREICNPNGTSAHSSIVHSIVLAKSGNYLVSGGADRLVKVFSMPNEELIYNLDGHSDSVLSVSISHDSEIIVSGSCDGSIRVWRSRDGSQMCWFTSNIEILDVKISNDKRAIVGLGERNNHRKLIMLQIVRNRTRQTRQQMPDSAEFGSRSSDSNLISPRYFAKNDQIH